MYFDRSHGTLGCIIFFHSEQLQEKPWNLASSIRLTKLTDSVSPFYKNGITTSRCFLTYMTLILYSPLGWKSTCIHKNPSNIMLLQTKARHNACATICLSPSTYLLSPQSTTQVLQASLNTMLWLHPLQENACVTLLGTLHKDSLVVLNFSTC